MTNSLKKIFLILEKKEKIALILIIIVGIFSTFLEMFAIVLILPIFDIVFSGNIEKYITLANSFFYFPKFSNDNNSTTFILLVVLAIFLIKNLLIIIINYYTTKFFFSVNLRIANDLFKYYLNSHYSFFLNNKSEDFLRKVYHDVDGIKTYLISYQTIFIEFLFLFLLFIFLFIVNKEITIFIFIIFFISFLFYSLSFKKKIMSWGISYQESIGGLQNIVLNGILGIKDLIIYNMENLFSKQFYDFSKKTIFSQFKLVFFSSLPKFYMELIVVFSLFVPMIVLINLDYNIQEFIPIISLFAISLFRTVPSANKILSCYNNIKFSQTFVDTYVDDLSIRNDNKKKYLDNQIYNYKDSFEFKNIKYSYDKSENYIFKNINFVINKKQSIAFVGPNGSGKSTLLNLICGLISQDSGKILIDGENVNPNRLWTKQISYVQQNIFLINKTIKENIVSSKSDKEEVDEKRLTDIDKLFDLNSVFSNFPDGLNSSIGYNGANLSGGQRQILSISRALYKNSELIIFDEASSALDAITKTQLKDLLLKLKRKKTIIFVTHEIDLFKECFDKVYSLNNGEIK